MNFCMLKFFFSNPGGNMAASAPKVVLSLLKNEESILSNYFPIPYQQMATIAILLGSMLKTAQDQ